MKLMAMVGDPRRVQDLQDILDPLRHSGDLQHKWISTEAAKLGKAYEQARRQLLHAYQYGDDSHGPIAGL